MTKIADMKTSDMVAEYNALTGKSIKKFSSRSAGEKQLAAARSNSPKQLPAVTAEQADHLFGKKAYKLDDGCPACGTKHDQTYAGLEGTAAAERMFCHHCSTEYHTDGRVYKAPAKSATRSAGIRKSWSDKNTHDLRSARHHVVVNGVEYRSVRAAFTQLGLPLSKHIKFRAQLKAARVLAWNDKFQFSLVAAD